MFQVGDIVQLKSGGPKMTVYRIIGHDNDNNRTGMEDNVLKMAGYKDGDVICQWFVRTKTESGTYKSEMVEKCETK